LLRRFRSFTTRSQRGSIAEGAAGLMLLTMLGIAALVLFLNAAFSVYYKLKLQAVTLDTAQYAAALGPTERDAQTKVTEHANVLLNNIGISRASKINISPDGRSTAVTIVVDGLPLMGGSFLPSLIALQDTEVATSSNRAVGHLELEWRMENSAPPTPEPADRAFLPMLATGQIDKTKNVYMLDTAYWPTSHVIYHGKYAGDNYRGPGALSPAQRTAIALPILYWKAKDNNLTSVVPFPSPKPCDVIRLKSGKLYCSKHQPPPPASELPDGAPQQPSPYPQTPGQYPQPSTGIPLPPWHPTQQTQPQLPLPPHLP
jgi:hypothetical protein